MEGEQTLDLNADETGKVSFPVEWGAYRLEVKAPNETVSSVRFWAGYSWQDNSDGSGAARPDRVTSNWIKRIIVRRHHEIAYRRAGRR